MNDAAPAATIKTTEHEEASRLPDAKWLWRRVLIFCTVGTCLLIAFRRSEAVTDPQTMREVIRYAFGIIALGLMLYGVGATVTDLATLTAAFKTTRKETTTTAPPPATITQTAAGGTTVSTPDDHAGSSKIVVEDPTLYGGPRG